MMEDIKRSFDRFYEVMAQTPVKIFNLGGNIGVKIISPRLFEKYCLPYYQEKVTTCINTTNSCISIWMGGLNRS